MKLTCKFVKPNKLVFPLLAALSCSTFAALDELNYIQVEATANDQRVDVTVCDGEFSPSGCWAMAYNNLGSGEFSLYDWNAATTPLVILNAAPDNSLYVDETGKVGLGTSVPGGYTGARLTVGPGDDGFPSINFSSATYSWEILHFAADAGNAYNDSFAILDTVALTTPFSIQAAAPNNSFMIGSDGFVGLGAPDGQAPAAKLHVAGLNDAKILVENTTDIATQTELFEIKNNGNLEFRMTNTNADSTWKFVAGTAGNSPGGEDSFRISKIGPGIRFQVFDTGNATLQGTLTQLSDVNMKQNIEPLEQKSVLEKVMGLPVTEWSYKSSPEIRHIGPMAQDFYKAFELGNTDKGISTMDTGGVALAAIQAVKHEKDSEIVQLNAENVALKSALYQLKAEQDERMKQLEMALAEVLRHQSSEVRVDSIN